jgi:hypothetical protein
MMTARGSNPPAALDTRPGSRAAEPARPDVRLIALGDMLARGADVAAKPGADALEAAATMTAAAADAYALAYGYGGALAVPAGLRVLARVAAAIERAAGAVPLEAKGGGRHVAA